MESNEQLVIKIKEGDNVSENMLKLWNNMKSVIAAIARKYKGYEEMDDLMQEGFLGLYEAINHYDKNIGVSFSTYSAYWIKQKINRYICECTRSIKIQEKQEHLRRKYKKFIFDYEKECGKKPSRGEICRFLQIDIEILYKLEKIENMANVASTDSIIYSDDGSTNRIIDTLPGNEDENSIIESIDYNMLRYEVMEVLNELPEDEKIIVLFKYIMEMETKEISKKIHSDEKDVVKIHRKAIRNLRKNATLRELKKTYSEYFNSECYSHVGIDQYNRTWTSITEKVALKV